jgi:DNA mismatch repair protein MutL
MGRIRILPDAVADQIAAGEVVERPASVVKELVENSLDAGATVVVVELEGGGRSMIRVSDDGCGMDRDDAVMALDRHATSKVSSISDLIGVPTYGFRGEALPSIASISLFELETAPADDDGVAAEGTKVVVRGGRIEAVEPVARSTGTTVTVRRVFYNTPARRKFLRSQRSETRAAVQALTVLALARLDVAFSLSSDDRVLLEAPRVSQVADRIAALFGRRTAEELLPVDHSVGPVSVRGFAQRPAEAKASGRKAHLFVNGRPFKDPFLIRAAENGYRATLPIGMRPTLILSVGISGDRVDVNVHPAKLEVRFRDRQLVERAVEDSIREALAPMEAAVPLGRTNGEELSRGPDGVFPDARPAGWSSDRIPAGSAAVELSLGMEGPALSTGRGGGDFLQVLSTYILFETPEGIAIVDQHSAHERVLYERTMTELAGGGGAAQRLLLPLTIDFEPVELDAIEENRDHLAAVGYEVEGFGGRSVVVHAVPNPHPRFDARRCFEELVADLAHGRFGGLNRLERFAATFACRAAVKAGDTLDQQEMAELIGRLFSCDLPPHDVHGRPTIVQLPKDELERRFGRS